MIYRKQYLEKIIPFIDTEFIKIITGIRRSGKSTILKQIMEVLKNRGITNEQILYINFEDYRYQKLTDKDMFYNYVLENLLPNKKMYLFFDEIQEVNEFQLIINSLNTTENCDIYITGSNSKLLSGELATYLTGRFVSFEIFMFSFKEFCEFYPDKNKDELLIDYITNGGLPSLHNVSYDEQKRLILQDTLNSITYKDLAYRFKIRNIELFERFMDYILNTITSQFSPTKILNVLKNEKRSLSRDTIYNYIDYLEESFLIYRAKRFDIKGKSILRTNDKLFVNDQGFRNLKYSNQEDIEKILENIVFFELLRRGYDVKVGEINGKEVDFIATKNNEIKYFQVSYLMTEETTREREFSSLELIRDAYPKYVITMDKVDFSRNGIRHLNIVDFLLS